jgi:hypothetical protein
MSVKPAAIFESDRCKVYLWDGVTPDTPGEPLSCDTFTARAVQAEGDFTRAYLDVSCGGAWESLVSMPLGGICKVDTEALKVRPRIDGAEGMSAKFYLVVRR